LTASYLSLAGQILSNRIWSLKKRVLALECSDKLKFFVPPENGYPHNPVVCDDQMKEVHETIEIIREYDSNVLISGESGTGKSMLARRICKLSPRADSPFIEVNCGSLNDHLLESELFGHAKGAFTGAIRTHIGKIEAANTGTLFLDDINSASLAMQTKLLHVMENRSIQRVGENQDINLDIRFICASNRNLYNSVKNRQFREDLYYRIAVINLALPPLRERTVEIIPLIEQFIQVYNKKYNRDFKGLRKKDHKTALNYHWPGNVRELKNAAERSFVLSRGQWVKLNLSQGLGLGAQSKSDASTAQSEFSLKQAIIQYEKKYIAQILSNLNWNIDIASQQLKIGRSTLFNKIKRYDLRRVD
jgi:two-component system response regulator AtoC